MINIQIIIPILKKIDPDPEPKADLASCSECGWKGLVSQCVEGQDGDWESGYYEIDLCPVCEDGGEIDYDMSEECFRAWEEWVRREEVKLKE